MLFLHETPAGYALFKASGDKLDSQEPIPAQLKLQAFRKFENTAEALAACTAVVDGKMGSDLKKFLKKQFKSSSSSIEDIDSSSKKSKKKRSADEMLDGDSSVVLGVSESKLGSAISKKFKSIQVRSDQETAEWMRAIREHSDELLAGHLSATAEDLQAMALGLAHSLSRYKLKFSPDKVDTMIVQAIGLLDDLDKELNTYTMRLREWFGWHFPEMSKLIQDPVAYARTIKAMNARRENCAETNFEEVLPEEVEAQIKQAAEISMGTEISEEDVLSLMHLAEEVVQLNDYRSNLYTYLQSRMQAIAPNLTQLVGELVGARLIAHAGSLVQLAKHPASTVQILGAEKALFRALKSKKDTPKYGLIYHASLVGQAGQKTKGKMARMLAAKAALATRVDALTETTNPDSSSMNSMQDADSSAEMKASADEELFSGKLGMDSRVKLESQLKQMENQANSKSFSKPNFKTSPAPKFSKASPRNGRY